MKTTIFYSWQSDLENRCNRSFIQNALEKATKQISKDDNYNISAVIDRDTFGELGSPSIVESITGKIAKSDIFVCDISIINDKTTYRKTPNPNVLYELGFASAILGWDRIIMIQNTAYGTVEDLPFDLRGRRILQYNYNDETSNKKSKTEELEANLINVFRVILRNFSKEYLVKEKNIWWGSWENESKVKVCGGSLEITRVSSDSFFFKILIFDGARTGDVNGRANILTPNSAFSRIKTISGEDCEIIFRRRLEKDSWLIEIEEGNACKDFHGHNTTFSGVYKHKTELVIDEGFLSEIDLNEIQRLTGRFINDFLGNFQQFNETENIDGGEYRVVSAGVKGLYTIMEAIVVTKDDGCIWCAFIDPENDVLRYFSNNPNQSRTMQSWLNKFNDKEIIRNDDNHIVHSETTPKTNKSFLRKLLFLFKRA